MKTYILGTVTVLIAASLLFLEPTLMTRKKRNQQKTDQCLQQYRGVTLTYESGSHTSYTFDLCQIIDCNGKNVSWRGYDVYICGLGWPGNQAWCPSWDHVLQATNRNFNPTTRTADGKLKTAGHINIQRDFSPSQNPITFSITNLTQSPYPSKPTSSGACWTTDQNIFYLVLGVDVSGKDPMGLLQINITQPSSRKNMTSAHSEPKPEPKGPIRAVDYTQLKPEEVMGMATGYTDQNLWLSWLAQTAREQSQGDCVACASARPQLITVPAPLYPNDTVGYSCMRNLTFGRDTGCETLGSIFPPISNKTLVGPFTPDRANGSYICFNVSTDRCPRTHSKTLTTTLMGSINQAWCSEIRSGEEIGTWARAGLYFYCGTPKLHIRLPSHSRGLCAMVRLRTPLILLGEHLKRSTQTSDMQAGAIAQKRRRHIRQRARRTTTDVDTSFSLDINNPTYIDAIGVPRGVPNEYKLVDQVAAGLENIPVIAALFPVTPNKNVDRINYVHYNVLRLTNLTRDAIQGLAEQMAPTSLMAVQNRMALDMLLAEKGGVCAMFGDMCCTFIPNNTAPDGSVSKALEGLRTLSKTMHEHSGINNPLDEWLSGMFGKWKTLIVSLFMSIAVFLAILITCGCCCVPCIRSLIVRLVTTTIEGKAPPPYALPYIQLPQDDSNDALGSADSTSDPEAEDSV